jgi:hypothetical protein
MVDHKSVFFTQKKRQGGASWLLPVVTGKMIFILPVLFSGVGKVAGGGAKRREEELAPPLGGVNNARLIAGASLSMIEDDVGWFWVGRALPSSETFGPKVNPGWFRESGGKPTKGGTGEPALYMLSNQSLEYVCELVGMVNKLLGYIPC